MTNSIQPLESEALCHYCDPEQFTFDTTADLDPLTEIIGQERAIEAVRFGISIRHEGYNLFAMGSHGTGKFTAVRQYLEHISAVEPVPADWCYVNNFEQPYKPQALKLPPGQGLALCNDVQSLVHDLHNVIPSAFESEDYQLKEKAIAEAFKKQTESAFNALHTQAQTHEMSLVRSPNGWGFVPLIQGQAISPEDFQKLPAEHQDRIKEAIIVLDEQLKATLQQSQLWEGERLKRVEALSREVATLAVAHLIDKLRQKYADQGDVVAYLDAVQLDVVENVSDFTQLEQDPGATLAGVPLPRSAQGPPSFRRYQVNVVVDNSSTEGAPVVYEDHPTYAHLVGQIEQTLTQSGALMTDFNLIKPGALHRANGGYLILDTHKVLREALVWEQLKRALRSEQIRTESPAQVSGMASTISLEPEPIPLSVKIILLGDRRMYYTLHEADPDFGELFKVVVDFAEEMARNPENNLLYARMIGTVAGKEGLRPFDRSAVARILEHSARLVGHSQRLSARMQHVADLLREADFWAGQSSHDIISAADVQQALDAQIRRVDRVREQVQEQIQEETILIDTDGEKVGQVNGLSVLSIGNFAFGRPSRITALVRPGKGEVIDIEREVELGGPLHSKGVLILASLLGSRYASDRPLSLTASLVFEQSYGGVDGDSASSTELYALLSALANVPIKQAFAVTGSVNQHGEVQAIGGVNEKVEGYFDLCRERGLTDEQGVLIPASNVKHLMLRQDVIDAVIAGQFSIYPVETIDQGIEVLTGIPAGQRNEAGLFPNGTINQRVETRLTTLASAWKSFEND